MTTKEMFIFDLETDGLLDTMTTIHCAVAKNWKTKEVHTFGPDNIKEFVNLIDGQVVIGHNIIGFDLPALDLWTSWMGLEPVAPAMEIDTLVLSRLLNPDRKPPEGVPHRVSPNSLEAWGYRVGLYKGEYGKQEQAFDNYNEAMLSYCVRDVEVTERVYQALLKEMQET